MLLTLNMPFADIDDPNGLCRDMTGVGHQGNGDVQASFTSLDQLPHIMGLVRQAFEKQKGNGNEP
jgi:predicted transport protein